MSFQSSSIGGYRSMHRGGIVDDQSSISSFASSASSSYSENGTGIGLIGDNGVIEDVSFTKYPKKKRQEDLETESSSEDLHHYTNVATSSTTTSTSTTTTPTINTSSSIPSEHGSIQSPVIARNRTPTPSTPSTPTNTITPATPPTERFEQLSTKTAISPTTSTAAAPYQSHRPTVSQVSKASSNGSTKQARKDNKVLRSSLSMHSFKQAFKIGVQRQHEPMPKMPTHNPESNVTHQPYYHHYTPPTPQHASVIVTDDRSSLAPHSPRSSLVSPQASIVPPPPPPPPPPPAMQPPQPPQPQPQPPSQHVAQASQPLQNQVKEQPILSQLQPSPQLPRSPSERRSMSGTPTSTSSTYEETMTLAEHFGIGGPEMAWGYAKPRIFKAMREHSLMKDGTAVNWISSLNITWTSGIGYISDDGSLALRGDNDTLHIPNLRLTKIVATLKQRYIELVINPAQNGCTRLILTPTSDHDFFKWTGALLVWTNLKPMGLDNKISMPQLTLSSGDANILVTHFQVYIPNGSRIGKKNLKRRPSSAAKSPVIKKDISSPLLVTKSEDSAFANDVTWVPAAGVLRENGVMDLVQESDGSLIQRIHLPSVLSSRVRRIDYSLFDCPHVLYIQPAEGIVHTNIAENTGKEFDYHFYISFSNDDNYEDWYSTLKAFTRKRIFGPTSMRIDKSFRTSRKINVRVVEARAEGEPAMPDDQPLFLDTYVEVAFENLVWARTFVSNQAKPFWREDFVFDDFPVRAPSLRLVVKRRLGRRVSPKQDPVIGHVDITDLEIISAKDLEKWYPLTMAKEFRDTQVCSICVRIDYEQTEILSQSHYAKLHDLISSNVGNNLTIQIAEQLPNDLNKLSGILLNIFQTENKSVEWITSLIVAELVKIRESVAESSNALTADFRFNVDNTLFRGNSLASKALERYMKLVGHGYLKKIIGKFVQKILDVGLFLEVDPNRISPQFIPEGRTAEDVSNDNQQKLTKYVSYLWSTIRDSTNDMPYSFKLLFKRLRLDLSLRLQQEEPVIFNAVSGFLFLRFFCPALLNPKVVGLVRAHPQPHVQRSLTLIAKMLQGFANRVRFGLKEPWMVPLNSFIDAHEHEMTLFYRDITLTNQSEQLLGATQANTERPFKEQPFVPLMGDVYSNPYLVDQLENYAKLVELWTTRENSFVFTDAPPSNGGKAFKGTGAFASNSLSHGGAEAVAVSESPSSAARERNHSIIQLEEGLQTDISSSTIRAGHAVTTAAERPISTVSSRFEDAISDALEPEDVLRRGSVATISKQPTASSNSPSRPSNDSPSKPERHVSTSRKPSVAVNGQAPPPSADEKSPETRKSDEKRNTILAIQQEALQQFELETLALRARCNDIQQALYDNELIPEGELESYIANTFFTFNPETSQVTLRRYAVGFAQAAASAQQYGAIAAPLPEARSVRSSPLAASTTSYSPSSPQSSAFTNPPSPYMDHHQHLAAHQQQQASPDNYGPYGEDESDRMSTMSKRFPKWGRLRRK